MGLGTFSLVKGHIYKILSNYISIKKGYWRVNEDKKYPREQAWIYN